MRARENRKGRGGRSQRTFRARATSNQVFVDVIIARKRAPSHRVFVAQVFGRNMWAKRRRRFLCLLAKDVVPAGKNFFAAHSFGERSFCYPAVVLLMSLWCPAVGSWSWCPVLWPWGLGAFAVSLASWFR